jgi:hypothetical protein
VSTDELSRGLRKLAQSEPTSAPPVASLLRRGQQGRRDRHGRRLRLAGAAVAASLLVAGAVRTTTATQQSARVPLAFAAQTTEATTFGFRLETTLGGSGDLHTLPWHGSVDPVHDRSYWRTDPMGSRGWFLETRQLGSACYARVPSSGSWRRDACCRNLTGSPETAALGAAGDPRQLLTQLQRAGQVTYAGRDGAGRVDSYRFRYVDTADEPAATKTGTVQIDVAKHRIVQVSYRVEYAPTIHAGQQVERLASVQAVLRLEDFGAPVDVAVPPGVTGQRPSGTACS